MNVMQSTTSAATTFAADAMAAAAARRWLRAGLLDWGCPALVEAAELCVSELVTNALRHCRREVFVRATLANGRLRVEVRDDDVVGRPVRRGDDELAEGGRGLLILDHLTEAWGVTPGVLGKSVWFELA
ncbi:MAG TPA: ATP-binding protein [Acidimicrobiales bacterium]|nr:ATP-binding protein [Acidimicrobiales bacterium]